MIIDNYTSQEFRYELYLCKPYASFTGGVPNHEIIGCLTECAHNISVNKQLKNVNELSFGIYPIWNDVDNTENTYFDQVNAGQMILLQTYIDDTLQNSEYLYIYQTDLEGSEKQEKNVKCYSKHYQWNKIKIRQFQSSETFVTTRKIYDGQTFDASDSTKGGIMDYILQQKLQNTWRITYISSSISDKYRTFDISEQSLLDVVHTIEDMYNCIFFFDTYNHTIQIKTYAELSDETGLIISGENYLKSIKEQIKIDEIVTRLYPEGKSGTQINEINVTGQAYIDDFSFFRSTTYMSQSLLDAFDAYDLVLTSYEGTFASHLSYLTILQDELAALEDDLADLTTELHTLEDNEDGAIAVDGDFNGHNYSYWHSAVLTKQSSITSKENAITLKEAEISSVNESIAIVVHQVSYEHNFTTAQLQELLQFINEETVKCDTEDASELLSYAQDVLTIKASPPIEFECDITDIFSASSENYAWDKLVLGSKIDLEYEDFSIQSKPRIVAYTHNVNNGTLSVTVSNKTYYNDTLNYISNIIALSRKTSTILANERENYNQYNLDKTNILTTSNVLNTGNNSIESGNGTIIDRRGMFMRDILGAAGQMRILDDKIVMTNDNWATFSTAITSNGVRCNDLWVLTNTDRSVRITGERIEVDDMELDMTANGGKNRIIINNGTDAIKIEKSSEATPTATVFSVDANGNLVIVGNITMEGGTITWTNVNSDPAIQSLADGEYPEGTFISGTEIKSPSVTGGTVTGATIQTGTSGNRLKFTSNGIEGFNTYNERHGVYVPKGSVNESDFYIFNDGDQGLYIHHHEVSPYGLVCDQYFKSNYIFRLYNDQTRPQGYWDYSDCTGIDFTGVSVTGLSSTATFG